jgi:hypothetical protein
MLSPTNRYVVSMVVILPIRGGTGVLMNVLVQEHRAPNKLVFDVAKFTIPAPLPFLS